MAVEVEGTSQLEEFLGILKRRAWWIVVPTVVIGTLGIAFAVIVPKQFVSIARVLVRDAPGVSTQSPGGTASRSEGQMAPALIRSPERINQVLAELRWPEYLEMTIDEKDEYRRELSANLGVDLEAVPNNAGAQIVNMRFGDTDPQHAYGFLRTLVITWKNDVQKRHQESLKAKLKANTEQQARLENERVELQKEMDLLKRAHGLPPERVRDDRGRTSFSSSLADEVLELEVQQTRALEAERALQRELDALTKEFEAEPQWIPGSQVVAATDNTARQIAGLEAARAAEIASLDGLTPQNRTYKLAQKKIRDIDRQLNELRGLDAVGQPRRDTQVLNPRWGELSTALTKKREALRNAEERRKSDAETLEVLRERRNNLTQAISALELMEARFDEVGVALESIAKDRSRLEEDVAFTETDAGQFFEDLELPTVPKKATKPNPLIIAVLSILGGLALGLGVAVLSEFSRNTFRSGRDLSRVMVVPVLGTVNRIVTRRQRSRLFFARTALAVGTATFVLAVGYVTWAWAYDPDALSEPVRRAIQGIREPFL